jgi:5'-3' exonuclease
MGISIIENHETVLTQTPIMLVDSSYLTYNRFYASLKIFESKYNKKVLPEDINDVVFLDIFTKNYFRSLKKMIKRFRINYMNVYLVRDCPRANIWRMDEMPKYKKNRDNTTKYQSNKYNIGSIFKYVYSNIYPYLMNNYGVNVIKVEQAEADDVIAVMSKMYNINELCNVIYIISEDKDMFQLLKYNKVKIYNMKFKRLGVGIDPEEFTNKKIILGDKSDNIGGLYIKDIDTSVVNTDLIKIIDNNCLLSRNRKLIDFDYIPEEIVDRIYNTVCDLQFNYYLN